MLHPVIKAIIRGAPSAPTLLTSEKDTEAMSNNEDDKVAALYGRNPPTDADRVAYQKRVKLDEKASRDRHPNGTFTANALAARKRLGMSPEDPDLSRTSASAKQRIARAKLAGE